MLNKLSVTQTGPLDGQLEWKLVVLIYSNFSMITQAVKLHENFDHFKYTLRMKTKSIWCE